jgi:hypothetical protein
MLLVILGLALGGPLNELNGVKNILGGTANLVSACCSSRSRTSTGGSQVLSPIGCDDRWGPRRTLRPAAALVGPSGAARRHRGRRGSGPLHQLTGHAPTETQDTATDLEDEQLTRRVATEADDPFAR